MMVLFGNLFYIVLFTSLIGSIFSIFLLLVKKVLHLALPLWLGICGRAFFLVPVALPFLHLIPPENPQWIHEYEIACRIWLMGAAAFGVYSLVRGFLARRALRRYRPCHDARIHKIFAGCVIASGLKKEPALYFGTLCEPACVTAVFHPAIILREDIAGQLTDQELFIVLCHEVTHIRRGHLLFQALAGLTCILQWFNPFAWISKNDFAAQGEMDCDQSALSAMRGRVTGTEYATAMLRLMELSAKGRKRRGHDIAALGFLLARERLHHILHGAPEIKNTVGTAVMVLLLAFTLLFSMYVSRFYFYPYPGYTVSIELADPGMSA